MTEKTKRKSFIFYESFYEALEDLPEKNQLELYKAIARYSIYFEESSLNGLSNTIFKLIKPQLDANNKRFINGKKGAEHGKKGTEHGKKGGRPKKETPLDIKNNPPKNPPNNNNNNNNNVNNNNNKLIVQNENHFADMTGGFLKARYSQMERNKPINQKDFDNIKKLIEIDLKNRDNPEKDVKKAMQSVLDNSGKKYFPVIESSKSFRDKFFKIENYTGRKTEADKSRDILAKYNL